MCGNFKQLAAFHLQVVKWVCRTCISIILFLNSFGCIRYFWRQAMQKRTWMHGLKKETLCAFNARSQLCYFHVVILNHGFNFMRLKFLIRWSFTDIFATLRHISVFHAVHLSTPNASIVLASRLQSFNSHVTTVSSWQSSLPHFSYHFPFLFCLMK